MTNKKYWNKNLTQMKSYVPGYQPPHIDDLIKLNTNENPYPPTPKIFLLLMVLGLSEFFVEMVVMRYFPSYFVHL